MGRTKTVEKIESRYYWPNQYIFIENQAVCEYDISILSSLTVAGFLNIVACPQVQVLICNVMFHCKHIKLMMNICSRFHDHYDS